MLTVITTTNDLKLRHRKGAEMMWMRRKWDARWTQERRNTDAGGKQHGRREDAEQTQRRSDKKHGSSPDANRSMVRTLT